MVLALLCFFSSAARTRYSGAVIFLTLTDAVILLPSTLYLTLMGGMDFGVRWPGMLAIPARQCACIGNRL